MIFYCPHLSSSCHRRIPRTSQRCFPCLLLRTFMLLLVSVSVGSVMGSSHHPRECQRPQTFLFMHFRTAGAGWRFPHWVRSLTSNLTTMTDENTVTKSKKPGLGKERHEPRSPRVPWRHSAQIIYGQKNGFMRSRRCASDSEKFSFEECFPNLGVCWERKSVGDELRKPPDELPVLLVGAFLLLNHLENAVPGAHLLLGVAFCILHFTVPKSGHRPIPCTQQCCT